MRTYLILLRTPRLLRITGFQLFARLPLGMLSLAILLHVSAETGSYTLAGAVAACVSIAEAVAMPLTARLSGAIGVVAIVLPAAAVNAAAMAALALVPPNPFLMAALGIAVGASIPPLMPVIRALYPRMVPTDTVRALFAFDTSAQELIWVVGPLVATVLAASVSTAAPLLVAAAVTALGTVGFVGSLGRYRAGAGRNTESFGRVLARKEVVLAAAASFALVASFMALEVGAIAQQSPARAGVALALVGVGSLIGGLLFGHRETGVWGVTALLVVVAIGTGLAGLVSGPAQLLAMFASGFGFAPAMAALYAAVSNGVPEGAAAEAFGWLNTGSLVGGAIGTALAGVASDAYGPIGAFEVATVLAVIAVACPPVMRATGPIRGTSADRRVPATVSSAG